MRDRRGERGETITILAVAGFAISALSAYLSYKRNKAIVKDDNPNTAVERGAWIPYVVGRRRIGPRVLWVDGAGTGPSFFGPGPATAGGKRGSRGGNYRAKVWHGLCIGPASRIRRIWFNGKVVSDGDINPDYVPSGTAFHIGGVGTFRVYWGERDQPADALLTAAFGFASNYPYLCSVVWDSMELGTVPQHPLVEYEVEVQAHGSELNQSPAWITASATDPGAGANIPTVAVYVPDRSINVGFDRSSEFKAQQIVRVSGAGAVAIFGKSQVYCDVTYAQYDTAGNVTIIYLGLETTRTVINPIVQVGDYVAICSFEDNDDGVNPAHMLYHLLFSSWPWGCALDPAEYDINSFEDFGAVAYFIENLRGDILAQDGELAEAILAQVLQDYGLALPFDYNRGKYILVRMREPNVPRANIGRELQLPALPEIETIHNQADNYNQIVFSFSDRDFNYRDMTIVAKSDKGSLSARFVNTQEVKIPSTTHFGTARQIAVRRAQEEFGNKAKFRIFGQNDVRYMIPGFEHEAYGIPFVLRMISNQPDSLSAKTEVVSFIDVFGSNLEYNQDTLETSGSSHFGTPPDPSYPVPDLLVKIVEPPRYIDDEEISIAVFRIRGSASVIGANIWLSTDDSTYYKVDYHDAIFTAIDLTATIPLTYTSVDAAGSPVGSDVPIVAEDLTGSEESWRLGRQIAVVGDELMYVRSVDSDGMGGYLPKGLLRGRLGTTPASHASGEKMYIAQSHLVKYIKSNLIQPGKTIYIKTQPVTSDGGELPLTSVTAASLLIKANAWRPISPVNVNTPGNTLSWVAGTDLELRWRYFSTEWHKTGAGMQGAGNPTARSPVQGEFTVEFYTTGDVLKGKFVVDKSEIIIPNADIVTMFGSEPSSLKVKVYNIYGGFSSTAITVTLVKT